MHGSSEKHYPHKTYSKSIKKVVCQLVKRQHPLGYLTREQAIMVNSRTVMEMMVMIIENHSVNLTHEEFETIMTQMTFIFDYSPQQILNTVMHMIENHSIDIDEDEMFSLLYIIQTIRAF